LYIEKEGLKVAGGREGYNNIYVCIPVSPSQYTDIVLMREFFRAFACLMTLMLIEV
jgi:hypothetical protein